MARAPAADERADQTTAPPSRAPMARAPAAGRVRRLLSQVPGLARRAGLAAGWIALVCVSLVWPAAARMTGPTLSHDPASLLPMLIEAGPVQSVWLVTAPADPAFPAPCGDGDAIAARFTTSGPAHIYEPSCYADLAIGLRTVVVVQGPRCVVAYEGAVIERRHCLNLPQVRNP